MDIIKNDDFCAFVVKKEANNTTIINVCANALLFIDFARLCKLVSYVYWPIYECKKIVLGFS
jgi:hypothetical protein